MLYSLTVPKILADSNCPIQAGNEQDKVYSTSVHPDPVEDHSRHTGAKRDNELKEHTAQFVCSAKSGYLCLTRVFDPSHQKCCIPGKGSQVNSGDKTTGSMVVLLKIRLAVVVAFRF